MAKWEARAMHEIPKEDNRGISIHVVRAKIHSEVTLPAGNRRSHWIPVVKSQRDVVAQRDGCFAVTKSSLHSFKLFMKSVHAS